VPQMRHVIISPKAEVPLNYIRAKRQAGGSCMRRSPCYESGAYRDEDIAQLLSAGAIEPHPDPNRGWVVSEAYR